MIRFFISTFFVFATISINAQDVERVLPAKWDSLVYGGRFADRFLPMPILSELTEDTWGSKEVLPRDMQNGIEDPEWSYWGGRPFKAADGSYNIFICRWPEGNQEGHWAYHFSEVVRAVSDHPLGPYQASDEIVGQGHNPDLYQLKDGRYVIYIVGEGHQMGYYISESLEGPWEKGEYVFDLRDRKKLKFMVNMSFIRREDGSFIAMPRAGDMWISETGISQYYRISNKSTYPPMEGRYEDPVIWKTDVQYHKIVNDWYGRIAHYQRSKDGIHWTHEPGLAYYPGISVYEDGTVTNWYKYERIRLLQDEYGRAIQANFAVIDTSKHADFPNDNHNSKNISIPLTKGRLMEVLNKDEIGPETKEIQIRIKAEADFDPHKDIDFNSLRLGSSQAVNYGGGSKLKKIKKDGKDLIIRFHGKGNDLTAENFAVKLLGRTTEGDLLFGWARLPGVDFNEPILSARKAYLKEQSGDKLYFEVQNFGMVASELADVVLEINHKGQLYKSEGQIPSLSPYGKTIVTVENPGKLSMETRADVKIYVKGKDGKPLYDQFTDLMDRPGESIIVQEKTKIKRKLPSGEITQRDSKGKHGLYYYIYLPTGFDYKNPPPIVIAFSPSGNGRGMVKKMKDAAEEAGWIVVGCDSLRNRMNDQKLAEEFEDEFLRDILQTVPHNDQRIYLAGFSGGAMRAYSITARRKEKYAGVIAYGGWLGGDEYQDRPYREGMSVAIINGLNDKGANKWSEIDSATLQKRGCSVKQFTHAGGHKVAPTETTIEAIQWLNEEWNKQLNK